MSTARDLAISFSPQEISRSVSAICSIWGRLCSKSGMDSHDLTNAAPLQGNMIWAAGVTMFSFSCDVITTVGGGNAPLRRHPNQIKMR